jgi:hypothetical protein
MSPTGGPLRTLSRCQALVVAHGEQHIQMMLGLCRSVGFTNAADMTKVGLGTVAGRPQKPLAALMQS